MHTNLPGTAAADDLALITGTFLTSAATIQTLDFVNTTTTAYGRFQYPVPANYVAGQAITLTLNVSCAAGTPNLEGTVDAFVTRAASPATDICATAVQNYGSAAADYSFTITPTNVVAGELLDIRVKLTGGEDTAAGSWIAVINSITLKFTVNQNG